ncbi:MAG: hypothetical protein HY243_02020 [Proteobacteria bacterium]|nr:hypothetical protein [Pseudomonadota bacterium]
MLTNVLELDRYRPVHFDFFRRQPDDAAANDRISGKAVKSPDSRCGRLDLVRELGEAPDDPILVIDRHLRRLHQASKAMKHARPGSWSRRYWTKVHRQLKRRRESLNVPWMSDCLNSPGELLWQPRDAVLEVRHDY